MIAPAGFSLATGFVGYQHAEKNASIMLVFMPGPFDQVSKGLTAENLLKTGVVVSKMDSMNIEGYPARWIEGSQQAYGSKFLKRMLIYGNGSKTILVNCAYPEEFKDLEQAIEKAARSVRYVEKLAKDSIDHTGMTIDTQGTNFSLQSKENKILSFKSTTVQGERPALFITAPSVGKAMISDQKIFSISRLKQLPGAEGIDVREATTVEIDGMSGYEVLGEKSVNGSKSIIYQVTLFNDENEYYIMVGTASDSLDQNLSAFKKLARTFRRK